MITIPTWVLLLALLITLTSLDRNDSDQCPEDATDILWPQTSSGTCSHSNPLSVDENLETCQRCCSESGEWSQSPKCTAQPVINACPDGFINTEKFCYIILNNVTYPPKCPYPEVLPFKSYVNEIGIGSLPVWIPIQRYTEYGPSVFYWVEPTSNYRLQFDLCKTENCTFTTNSLEHNCAIYWNASYIEAVPCTSNNNFICAYEYLHEKKKGFCEQSSDYKCVSTDYSNTNCFCIDELSNDDTKAEFIFSHQNLLVQKLTNKTCSIGLEKINGTYKWSKSNVDVNYTYWSPDAEFGVDFNYGLMTPNGWVLTDAENTTNCSIIQGEIISDERGDIIINYLKEENVFRIEVTHSKNWVQEENDDVPKLFCFTDTSVDKLIDTIEFINVSKVQTSAFYYFQPSEYSGNFWCEGFLYPDLKVKSTKPFLIRNSFEEYTFIATYPYEGNQDPLSHLETIRDIVVQGLQSSTVSTFVPRIYKINSVDEINSKLIVNIHLSNTVDTSETASYASYSAVTTFVNKLQPFTSPEVKSADACFGFRDGNNPLTWPTTLIGEIVEKPREEGWCVAANGTILHMKCLGNFVDGGEWSGTGDTCELQTTVNTTVHLNSIIRLENPQSNIQRVANLINSEVDVFDISLITQFLTQLSLTEQIPYAAVTIINNLIDVPDVTLNAANEAFYSIYEILSSTDKIVEQLNFDDNDVEVTNNFQVFVLPENESLVSIPREEQIVNEEISFLYFSEEFKEEVSLKTGTNPKIILTTFFKSNLFTIMDPYKSSTATVLKITISGIDQNALTNSYVITYFTNALNDNDLYCSYWLPSYTQDYTWQLFDSYYKGNLSQTCNINYPNRYLALVSPPNITKHLEDVLQESALINFGEMLYKTSDIIDSYHEAFKVINVVQVYEILSKFEELDRNVDDSEVSSIVAIINDMMDVPRIVLEDAHWDYNVTETMFSLFIKILYTFEGNIEHSLSNMYLSIISDGSEEQQRIFRVISCGNLMCDVRSYSGDYNDNEIADDVCVISFKAGPPDPNNRIYRKDHSQNYKPKSSSYDNPKRIIANIMYKDSFFIVKNESLSSSAMIVGVMLPDLEDPNDFQGQVTVSYNGKTNYDVNKTCGIWWGSFPMGSKWISTGYSSDEHGRRRCNFQKMGYYSLIRDTNFTAVLEDLLHSNHEIEFVISKTDYILLAYLEYFTAYEVFLIANILDKIDSVNELILAKSFNIVDNLINVNNEVLDVAQQMFNASNIILKAFWRITGSYGNIIEMNGRNLMMIISNVKESNLTGLEINNCDEICNVTILENYEITGNTPEFKLEISKKLLNKVASHSDFPLQLIVITIFHNNTLFIDDLNQNSTTVLGVQFPQFPISLPYKLKLYSYIIPTDHQYFCVKWQDGYWDNEGTMRVNIDSSCSFYKQGYLSFMQETGQETSDVTKNLQSIKDLQVSFSEKMFKAESVSYQFDYFRSESLEILAEILSDCGELDESDLQSVIIIMNNIMQVDRRTLHESQTSFDALSQILKATNCMAGSFNSEYTYNSEGEHFWLLLCELDDTFQIFVGLKHLSCSRIRLMNDILVTVELSEETKRHILSANPNAKLVVTIFFNNVFFAEFENDTSIVVGLNVPGLESLPNGELGVSFSDLLNIKHLNNCGSWDYITNSKSVGTWLLGSTNKEGQFTSCKYQEPKYYSLLNFKLDCDDTNVTEVLERILKNNNMKNKIFSAKGALLSYHTCFRSYDVYLLEQILATIDDVQTSELEALCVLINSLIELPRQVLMAAQEGYKATDLILYYLDLIPSKFEGELIKIMENFAMVSTKNVTAIGIDNCEKICQVSLETDYISREEFEKRNLAAGLYVEEELRRNLDDVSASIVFTVFFKDSLFIERSSDSTYPIGNILGVEVYPPTENLSGSFWFYDNTINNTEVCSYWNYNISEINVQTGYWQKVQFTKNSKCETSMYSAYIALLEQDYSNITSTLENILGSSDPPDKKLNDVNGIVVDKHEKIAPVDIYLISAIFGNVAENNHTTVKQMHLTSKIISNLFNVNRTILKRSQKDYNATDRILHNIDNIADMMVHNETKHIIIQDNFLYISIEINDIDVNGIVLRNCTSKDCNVLLENVTDLNVITDDKNVDFGVVLSEEVKNQIKASQDNPRLVVTVFFKDLLFNEESVNDYTPSMIFGVLIPGLNETLQGNINVLYNIDTSTYTSESCGYWNYKVSDKEEQAVLGFWKKDGEPENKSRIIVCQFDHITHFALLLGSSGNGIDDHVLDIITNVNCVLSLIGILGIMLTAVLFEKWRKNTGNQILVNFSVAISIKIVMLYVSGFVASNSKRKILCYVIGSILHYAVLSEFCWMLIIAILQFKRFVEVLGGRPKYVLLKACVCGWIFPIFPVLCICLIDIDNYSEDTLGLCYPSGLGLYLGIWLPLIIIITINFVIFIFIIYNIFHKKTEFKEQINYELLFQWRLALLLFSMLGLTWAFGFLSLFQETNVFVYLFCFTASLQGFVMFLFFIVFNKSTRFLYRQGFKSWLYSKGYKYH